jgi:hypothetical protein
MQRPPDVCEGLTPRLPALLEAHPSGRSGAAHALSPDVCEGRRGLRSLRGGWRFAILAPLAAKAVSRAWAAPPRMPTHEATGCLHHRTQRAKTALRACKPSRRRRRPASASPSRTQRAKTALRACKPSRRRRRPASASPSRTQRAKTALRATRAPYLDEDSRIGGHHSAAVHEQGRPDGGLRPEGRQGEPGQGWPAHR